MAKKLPKSVRKHIRKEKARIRREMMDEERQQELINQLYQRFLNQYSKTKDKQASN